MSTKKKKKAEAVAPVPAENSHLGTVAHLKDQEGSVNSILYQMHGRETVDLGHGRDRPAGPITRGDKLGMAAETGDLVAVKKLIKKGVDPNFRNAASGVTPLGVATERGHLEVMKALLDAGASVNNPTNEGVTPIHIASQFGPAAGVELLCRRGANVNTTCPLFSDAGPLLFATQLNKKRAIEVLIASRADVNGADQKGWTALHAAASFGHANVVMALIAGRADPGSLNQKGESALDVAVQKQNHEVVSLLTMAHHAGQGGPVDLLAAATEADGQRRPNGTFCERGGVRGGSAGRLEEIGGPGGGAGGCSGALEHGGSILGNSGQQSTLLELAAAGLLEPTRRMGLQDDDDEWANVDTFDIPDDPLADEPTTKLADKKLADKPPGSPLAAEDVPSTALAPVPGGSAAAEDSSVDGTLLELLPSAAEIKAMVSGDLSALPDEPLDILEEDAPSVARAKKIFHNGREGHRLAGGRPVQ
tara:strand:+ start:114 stop:1541 length:1428 start_codon:yes stop_codon:yes gene_type:complete